MLHWTDLTSDHKDFLSEDDKNFFFKKGGGGVKTCRFIVQLKTCNFDIQVRMSFLFKTKKENFQCNSYMYKNIE